MYIRFELGELINGYVVAVHEEEGSSARREFIERKVDALYAIRNDVDKAIETELKAMHPPVTDGTCNG